MKPYRDSDDPVLSKVSETHSVFIAPKSSILVIRRKVGLSAAEGLMADLGIDEEDLITFEEREMAERLKDLMADDGPITESNPFFDKRDR